MTFSMEYAYSENYILVLSTTGSARRSMPKDAGLGFDKFANLKVARYYDGYPGKKLFMDRVVQLREWSEERSGLVPCCESRISRL
ncbi:MAG: hypothetical protein ACLTGA_11950 [Roseburia sp.]